MTGLFNKLQTIRLQWMEEMVKELWLGIIISKLKTSVMEFQANAITEEEDMNVR